MFEREHHRYIARVLESLEVARLADNGCYFGGGTAIALRYGEFRESVDIDFLVSDRDGYRTIRESITGTAGIGAIIRDGAGIELRRDIRADRYGVRMLLGVEDISIKFEIVLEGRIGFDTPRAEDRVCGVTTLTPLDMAASKLLANSDRWADPAVSSRDLIDLAMMTPTQTLLREAIAKAGTVYGASVERDLVKAVSYLRENPERLDRCMRELQIATVPKALLWKRIRALMPSTN